MASFLGLSELGLRDQTCSLIAFQKIEGQREKVFQGHTEARLVTEGSRPTQKCESTFKHILVPSLKRLNMLRVQNFNVCNVWQRFSNLISNLVMCHFIFCVSSPAHFNLLLSVQRVLLLLDLCTAAEHLCSP